MSLNIVQNDGTLKNVCGPVHSTTNKRIIMIGDSYGVQNTDGDITKFYWEYIRDNLGMIQNNNFYSSFQSGAGFGDGEFLSQLQALVIQSPETITDIIVCGGWNDSDLTQSYGTDAKFYAGITDFDNYARAHFPNATISVAHISWGEPTKHSSVFTQMSLSIARYQDACGQKGWRNLTNTKYILHCYAKIWQSDGAHPNATGQKLLGERLCTAILTGSCDVCYGRTVDCFPYQTHAELKASGITTSITHLDHLGVGVSVFVSMDNGITSVVMPDTNSIVFGCRENLICNGGYKYELASFDSYLLRGYSAFSSINVPIYLRDSNNVYYSGVATMEFNNGKLLMMPMVITPSNTVLSATITAIVIKGFNTYLDTLSC